jgi:hypothetical protein
MARKSIAKRRLESIRRNRARLNNAISSLQGIPIPGPAGRIVRAVAQAPEPITLAASAAFNQELLAQALVNEEIRRQRMIDANADAGLRAGRTEISQALDETVNLAKALSNEELLDDKLVDEVVRTIETGRDVIRSSGQFRRDLILPDLTPKPKRTRKRTGTDKMMSKALRQANDKFRKSNGQLRKGATQAQIMRYAHKLVRRMKK